MIDIKPLDDSGFARTLSGSVADFCAIFYPPHDENEILLARHCEQHPLDETAALVHADRLQELDRPFLAQMERTRAEFLAIQRTLFDTMIQSLCVPESVLRGAESNYSGRSVPCMTSS